MEWSVAMSMVWADKNLVSSAERQKKLKVLESVGTLSKTSDDGDQKSCDGSGEIDDVDSRVDVEPAFCLAAGWLRIETGVAGSEGGMQAVRQKSVCIGQPSQRDLYKSGTVWSWWME